MVAFPTSTAENVRAAFKRCANCAIVLNPDGYVLRTHHDELDGERLWTLYMALAKAEEGFRMTAL